MDCGWYVNPDTLSTGRRLYHNGFRRSNYAWSNVYEWVSWSKKFLCISNAPETDIPAIEVHVMDNDADAAALANRACHLSLPRLRMPFMTWQENA